MSMPFWIVPFVKVTAPTTAVVKPPKSRMAEGSVRFSAPLEFKLPPTPTRSVPPEIVVPPLYVFAAERRTVPAVDLMSAPLPAREAEIVPACTAYELPLSVPFWIVPPVKVTAPTAAVVKPPKSKTAEAPLTFTAPVAARALAMPRRSVPLVIVVPPL